MPLCVIFFFFGFSYTSEILEIHADAPTLHVLFVPGNPGVASIVCLLACLCFPCYIRLAVAFDFFGYCRCYFILQGLCGISI